MCSQTCIKSIQKYCVSLNVSFVFGGHGVSPVLYCSSLLINRGGGLYLEITIFYSCYCSACRFIRETGNCWLFWLLLTWLVYLSLFVCVCECVCMTVIPGRQDVRGNGWGLKGCAHLKPLLPNAVYVHVLLGFSKQRTPKTTLTAPVWGHFTSP